MRNENCVQKHCKHVDSHQFPTKIYNVVFEHHSVLDTTCTPNPSTVHRTYKGTGKFHPSTSHKDPEGSRCIAVLFL